ncbi:MAG: hypothetical protein Kow0069_02800 [Promethearchaeota archaeon]
MEKEGGGAVLAIGHDLAACNIADSSPAAPHSRLVSAPAAAGGGLPRP